MPILIRLFMLTLMVSIFTSSAWAHQQKYAYTTAKFNERTGQLELVHRFNLHDAEHAIQQLELGEESLLSSPAMRERFATHVKENFVIHTGPKQKLDLSYVGSEVEGKYLYIMQEAPWPKDLASWQIEHKALMSVWPRQKNYLNVEYKKQVKSAIFSVDNDTQEIDVNFTSKE